MATKTKNALPMADLPNTVKPEAFYVSIDKTHNVATWGIVEGDTKAVVFHADEDCDVKFKDPSVFGCASLRLTHDALVERPANGRTEVTDVTIVPMAAGAVTAAASVSVIPTRRPWPILP